MDRKNTSMFLLMSFFLFTNCFGQDDSVNLSGSYLGQKPPGMTPEKFARGILNTETKGAFCTVFNKELNEFYFVYYDLGVDESGGLHWMTLDDNRWSKPKWLPFSKFGADAGYSSLDTRCSILDTPKTNTVAD